MTKTLVAFYSMTGESYVDGKLINLEIGNTHVAANMIAEMMKVDLFQIQTVKEYSKDHMKLIQEAKIELNNQSRPQLIGKVDDMDQYDTIILGYPNWWGTCPMPVFTFLESYNFANKTILPLCTNEGSGLSNSVSDIRKICFNANVKDGLAIMGSQVKNSKLIIKDWLMKNNMI